MLELLKITVQATLLERDPDGNIVGERVSEAENLYNANDYSRFRELLEAKIAEANAAANGDRKSAR